MKKIITQILTIVMITIIMMSTQVQAVGFTFTATPSKTTVDPGDELKIDLEISNIDIGENGINTLEGTLEYNREVFEEVKQEDITSLNGWSITYNDEATELNGKFLAMIPNNGVKEDQKIGTITLKVKENVKLESTQIVIKEIATNDGTNLVEEADKTIQITINQPNNNQNNGQQNGNENDNPNGDGSNGQNGSENNNPNNNGSGSNSETGSNNAKSGNSANINKIVTLPKAGDKIIYYTVGIIAIITIAIISYKKYKKYRKI